MPTLELNSDLLADSGIPRAFWEKGADTYPGDKVALEKVHKYATQSFNKAYKEGVGLYVHGESGSCKTFLVTYALRMLMCQGMDVLYTTLDEAIDLYFNKEKNQPLWRNVYSIPQFLAVDGVENTGKGATDLVFDQLVRLRKDIQRPLLVVSPFRMEELTAHEFKKGSVRYLKENTLAIHAKYDAALGDLKARRRLAQF